MVTGKEASLQRLTYYDFIMQLNIFTRAKTTKVFIVVFLFILLTVYLLVSDSIISSIHRHKLSNTCVLCPLKKNGTKEIAEVLHFSVLIKDNTLFDPVNVMVFFVHAKSNSKLEMKLHRCISSLFNYTSQFLHLHVLTDQPSLKNAVQILQQAAPLAKTAIKVTLYDVDILMKPLQDLIDTLRPHFSFKQGAYYSDGLFYISIGLFKVINLKRIILIDADVKFLDDIKILYNHFYNFSSEALVGIAREQQPVYRHVLHEYRRHHNNTKVGDPPPDGLTGFNSGVLLLDLEKMRNSSTYVDIINNSSIILQLIDKYKFKGHLGDQDFYTIISFEYQSLFYTLPCTWNRQLCQWWKYHGYKDIFSKYQMCTGKIHLLHGNCNSVFPDS